MSLMKTEGKKNGRLNYIQIRLGRETQLLWAQTCRASPLPGLIEKGEINDQTSLTAVINVRLPGFFAGHLIKNLLVAAGLLSHLITAPPC